MPSCIAGSYASSMPPIPMPVYSPAMSETKLPLLDGLRVVEIGVWVAGPSVGGLLSDWGADVVKIEPAAGDPFRGIFATLGYDPDLPNPPFALDNRGKRSVVLNTSTPEGQEAAQRLVARA